MSPRQKQHYVPQFLLRNFGDSREAIEVFDRLTYKTKIKGIKNVAFEHSFDDFIDDTNMRDSMEHRFSRFESRAASIIKRIIQEQSLTGLSEWDRKFLVIFVAMQLLRVRKLRSYLERIAGTRTFLKLDNTGIEITVKKGPDDPRRTHVSLIAQYTGLVTAQLSARVLALLVATGQESFVISDNPVLAYSAINVFAEKDLGVHLQKSFPQHDKIDNILTRIEGQINDSMTDVYMPLSPRTCLFFAGPQVAAVLGIPGCATIDLEDEQVSGVNLLQMYNSEAYVFGHPGSSPSEGMPPDFDMESAVRYAEHLLLSEYFLIRRAYARVCAEAENQAWNYEPAVRWEKT